MKKYFSQQKNTMLQKGFTIIETLVAITILMIAIAGPLTIAHKGLLAATYAADQVTASYLAQDMIEFVKNVKDNNIIKGKLNGSVDWLSGLSMCTFASPCSVDTLAGNPASPSGISNCDKGGTTADTSCILYQVADNSGFNYTSTGNRKTQYKRYFYVTPREGNTQNEANMTVIVSWNSGTIENVFAFENDIFKVTR